MESYAMKSLKEMEEAVDTITAYLCVGLIIILVICIVIGLLEFIIGLLVTISMGG